MKSSSEAAGSQVQQQKPALSRFALWPLPDLATPPAAAPVPGTTTAAPPPDPEQVAYNRGYEAGKAAATEDASRTIKRAAGLLVSTAEALDAARLGIVREMEDSVYLLSLAVARHLILREVSADPSVVRDLVQRGLESFPVGSHVEIHLNPEDLVALRSQFELPGSDARAAEIQWIADQSVERGGCTLETPHRVVDGRIDLALRDLYHRMRDD